jgi:hypothetical protein
MKGTAPTPLAAASVSIENSREKSGKAKIGVVVRPFFSNWNAV